MRRLLLGVGVLFVCGLAASNGRALSVVERLPSARIAIDSPYWSQHWRDSVNEYRSRLAIYRSELLDYDNAFMLSLFPFAAESGYTGQVGKGALFFFGRIAGGGAALTGTLGLVRDQGSALKNVILTLIGVGAYIFFKVAEVNDVQHDVSLHNEDMVADYHIALDDVAPGSIRYPVRSWPSWVTARPPARTPHPASDVYRAMDPVDQFKAEFQFPF